MDIFLFVSVECLEFDLAEGYNSCDWKKEYWHYGRFVYPPGRAEYFWWRYQSGARYYWRQCLLWQAGCSDQRGIYRGVSEGAYGTAGSSTEASAGGARERDTQR